MDWFVLLTPLLVLFLLPPVIVFGCGLDDHGNLDDAGKRNLQLTFEVPKTNAGMLNQLLVKFELSGIEGAPPLDTVDLTLSGLGPETTNGDLVVLDKGVFGKTGVVFCKCTVTFVGWANVAPPPAAEATCNDADQTIAFQLKWVSLVWNEPLKDYKDVQFSLLCADRPGRGGSVCRTN